MYRTMADDFYTVKSRSLIGVPIVVPIKHGLKGPKFEVLPTDSGGDAPRSTATCLWLSLYKTLVCLLIDWGTPDIRRRYRASPVSASLSPSGLARGAKLVLLVVLCGAGLGPTFHAAPLVSHSTFREFAVNPRVKTLTRDE